MGYKTKICAICGREYQLTNPAQKYCLDCPKPKRGYGKEYMSAYRRTPSGRASIAGSKKRSREIHGPYKSDPKKVYEYNLKRLYGITMADYGKMFIAQGGKCAACGNNIAGNKAKMMCVDHDHVTGKIRGLLCRSCNIAAGSLKDDPERAILLAEYLRRTQ